MVEDILNLVANYERPPLSLFISPPVLRFDPSPKGGGGDPQFPMIESTLKASLRDLFDKYSQHQRPVIVHAGEWITKARSGESAARDLFRDLKMAPVAILETEVEESFLNINLGFWNGNTVDICFKSVVRKLRWRDALDDIQEAKAKALEASGKLLSQASPVELDRFHRQCREELVHYLEVLHCVHAGMVVDEYFLLYSEPHQLPLLPQILPNVLAEETLDPEVQLAIMHQVIDYSDQLFVSLAQMDPLVVADLRLAWANVLKTLPERYGFAQQVRSAMQDWILQRGGGCDGESLADLCEAISGYLLPEDSKFVEDLNVCLELLEEPNRLNVAVSCFQRGLRELELKHFELAIADFDRVIALSPQADAYYHRALAYQGLENYTKAIEDLDRVIKLQPGRAEAYEVKAGIYTQPSHEDVEVALANYAEAINHGSVSARSKRDELQQWWKEERPRREAEEARKRQEEEEKRQREAEEARKRQEEEKRQREAEEARRRLISQTTGVNYAKLDQALRNRNWKEADELTRQLMCQVANRSQYGWLDEDSIRKFPGEDLKIIDRLWVEHSNGTLGFSVQKRIWKECGSPGSSYSSNQDAWIRFGKKVNWQGGTGYYGWRYYNELDMTDPQKYPGHLPVSPLGGWGGSFGMVGGLPVRFRGALFSGFGWLSSLARRSEL